MPAKVAKNVTNESNRLDIGLTTGIGLEVPIKKGFSLSFEARNNTGLYNTAVSYTHLDVYKRQINSGIGFFALRGTK